MTKNQTAKKRNLTLFVPKWDERVAEWVLLWWRLGYGEREIGEVFGQPVGAIRACLKRRKVWKGGRG